MALIWLQVDKRFMEDKDGKIPQDKDRHLNIPSEANRDKHIDFLDVEDSNNSSGRKDKETENRQKEWKDGIEEGKRMRENDGDLNK